jgi:hypothetical protein
MPPPIAALETKFRLVLTAAPIEGRFGVRFSKRGAQEPAVGQVLRKNSKKDRRKRKNTRKVTSVAAHCASAKTEFGEKDKNENRDARVATTSYASH